MEVDFRFGFEVHFFIVNYCHQNVCCFFFFSSLFLFIFKLNLFVEMFLLLLYANHFYILKRLSVIGLSPVNVFNENILRISNARLFMLKATINSLNRLRLVVIYLFLFTRSFDNSNMFFFFFFLLLL